MAWNADPGSLKEKVQIAAIILLTPLWLPAVKIYEWRRERARRKGDPKK